MSRTPVTIAETLAATKLERRRLSRSIERPLLWVAPGRVLPMMAASIFLAEVCVMVLLYQLPRLPHSLEALFDAGILLVLLSPTFYFFHYRPLKIHFQGRKAAIDQLLKSEERLELALRAANDGLWDWDIRSGQLYLSPRGMEILGYGGEGKTLDRGAWEELVHPDDREAALAGLQRHFAGETDNWEAEHRLKTGRGDWTWVLTRGQVVEREGDGKPLRAVGTITDISTRKRAEELLRDREEKVRKLSRQLMHSSEDEKKSIARDLHDDFNQVLTAFQFGVEMLQSHSYRDEEDYQRQCRRLLELVIRLQGDTRSICDKLRPVMLDDIGLVASLEWLVGQVRDQAPGLEVRLRAGELEPAPTGDCALVLYRICQEALTNILKHAEADRVDIDLGRTDDAFVLGIRDNGRGFSVAALNRRDQATDEHWGLGLLGMHERAAALAGRVRIDAHPGAGTAIEAWIPQRQEGRS